MNDFLPYITPAIDQVLFSLRHFYPESFLVLLFLLVILSDLFFSKKLTQLPFYITFSGLLITGYIEVIQIDSIISEPVFGGMILPDKLSSYFKLIFVCVSVLFALFIKSNKQLQLHKKGTGDIYAILLAVLLGMNLMAMSANLLMLYLSVEMVSLGSYLMVGYVSGSNIQAEASMKYALFGAVCSAIMLYGISLLYAFTGTLNLYDAEFITRLDKTPLISAGVAIVLVLIGLGFKLSFVPLHFWSPDIYQGAPTPVSAFLSTGPKIAGFAILIKFLSAFNGTINQANLIDLRILLAVVSFLSMVVGNFSAIWQNNVKRMLAYSSIGHTGFALMAVISFSGSDFKSLIFYLFIYAMMTMAAFMIADQIEERTGTIHIDEYKGLGKKMPLLFFMQVVVLVSLIGLPPTAGFIGKLFIFSSALEIYNATGSKLILLLLITGTATTVISLFYYFKIPLNAYLRDSDSTVVYNKQPGFSVYLIFALMVLLIVLGIFPQLITDLLI